MAELTNTMKNKIRETTKVLLRENFAKDWNNNRLPLRKIQLTENQKIVEADGREFKIQSAYEVPVWKLDEKNLNGRVYSKKLGEKVVTENTKTANLADHPEGDGSVKDIMSVSMNPHIRENILYVDTYFVDNEFQEKVEKMIEKGVGIGVSSSAYGELDNDGNVLEESFELERFFDYVNSPSYEVYLTKESRKEPKQENISINDNNDNLSININEQLITDSVTNKVNISKESTTPIEEHRSMAQQNEDKTRKPTLEEKNLIMGVKNLMEKAQIKEDLYEKRQAFVDALEYCDGEDYATKFIDDARSEISKIDEELHQLATKGKEADSLKESKEELEEKATKQEEQISTLTEQLEKVTEKFEMATKMLDDSKDRDKKLKEMYQVAVAERNGMVKASDYKELYTYTESIEEEKNALEKELRELKKKMKESTTNNRRNLSSRRRKYTGDSVLKESVSNRKSKQQETETVDETEYDAPDQIVEYYEDVLASNPEAKRIKKYILESKTLMEAQRAYLKFKDLIEDIPSPGSRKFEIGKVDYDTDVEMPDGSRQENGSLIESALKGRKGWY